MYMYVCVVCCGMYSGVCQVWSVVQGLYLCDMCDGVWCVSSACVHVCLCLYMLQVVGKLTGQIVPESTRIHDGYWSPRELSLSLL